MIPCGARKIQTRDPVPACTLYTGPLFTSMLATARAIARSDKDIWILSALHGPIPANHLIKTYDMKMSISDARRWKENWPSYAPTRGRHLLPTIYAAAVPNGIKPIVTEKLTFGQWLQFLKYYRENC